MLVEGEVAGLRLDDLDPILWRLCDSQVYLFVEPATTHDGRVKQIWSVGCPNNKNLVL